MSLTVSVCPKSLIKVIRSKYSDNTHSFIQRRLLAEPDESSDGPTWSVGPLCRQRSMRGGRSLGIVLLSGAAFWRCWSRPRIRSRSLGSSRTGKRSGSIDDGFGLFMAASRRCSPPPLLLRSGDRFVVPGASLPAAVVAVRCDCGAAGLDLCRVCSSSGATASSTDSIVSDLHKGRLSPLIRQGLGR